MSAAKCLLSLMVVLVAAGCAVHAHDRIKICGRELIRLAVSSCGNPRLRRSLSDIELQQHHFTWDHSTSMKEQVASEMIHIPSEYDEDDFVSLAAHWFPMSSRMRRSAAKISDICCEKGCSLQELIQFC
ncbi:insulin-like 3 (Leydig cell) [Sphaeramia orbicularis]|uniref:insulin-like 3 (Leydig cell) n=1 Tax=Sphaeramia orbicularis TaxID=375764 RepID=UPI00117D4F7A|nr:relaxin-3-like [Sphaeramia orbicularis]